MNIKIDLRQVKLNSIFIGLTADKWLSEREALRRSKTASEILKNFWG